MKERKTFKLVLCAILIATALLTNQIKIHFTFGGSITLCSMLFVILCAYLCGTKYGLLAGTAFGILNALIGGISSIHWASLLLDYVLAFGIMGLSGLFNEKKYGLCIGYIVGVLGRFFFSWLSGFLIFGIYAPAGQAPWLYSLLYQLSYIGPEVLITIIVLQVKPLRNAIYRLKEDPSLRAK